MCETIEFDRFVGVHVSRKREAGVVGDVDLFLLDDDVLASSAVSRVIQVVIHDSISMGDLVAALHYLFNHYRHLW